MSTASPLAGSCSQNDQCFVAVGSGTSEVQAIARATDSGHRCIDPHVDGILPVSLGHAYPQHHLTTPEVQGRHPPPAAAPCLRPPGPTAFGLDRSVAIQNADTAGQRHRCAPILGQAQPHLNRLGGCLLHAVRAAMMAGRLWSCSCWRQRLAPCCSPVTICIATWSA